MPRRRPEPGSPRVSLKTIADELGVAQSTVSRAFTNPKEIGEQTRLDVLAAAQRLGYVPNAQARSLVLGRTLTIGLVVPDITNPFFPPLVRAAQRFAREKGYVVLTMDADDSADLERELIREYSGRVDAFVLCSPRAGVESVRELGSHHPVVLMNSVAPGLSSVVFDTQGAYTDAIARLAQAGHRRVAYVAGPKASWADKERQRSIRAAVAASGRDLQVDFLSAGPATFDRGVSIAADLASGKYTAVLAFDDIIALGLLRGCRDAGVRVPDDLAVLGCDNIELDLVSDPGLATIATPVEDAARYAVDLAIARGSATAPSAAQTITLGSVFIPRASIG